MKKLIGSILILLSTILFIPTPVYAINSITGPDVVFKQTNAIVTIHDILLLYESNLGNISASSDGYSGYGHLVGHYEVELVATDGLVSVNKSIVIKVVENLGDVTLVGDGHDLYVRPDQVLTFGQIRNILKNTGYIQIPAGTAYQMITNQYSGNETTIGVYDYGFRLISPSGMIQTIELNIYVSDDFTSFDPGEIIPGDPSPVDSVWNSVVSIFWLIVFIGGIGVVVWLFLKLKKKRGFSS